MNAPTENAATLRPVWTTNVPLTAGESAQAVAAIADGTGNLAITAHHRIEQGGLERIYTFQVRSADGIPTWGTFYPANGQESVSANPVGIALGREGDLFIAGHIGANRQIRVTVLRLTDSGQVGWVEQDTTVSAIATALIVSPQDLVYVVGRREAPPRMSGWGFDEHSEPHVWRFDESILGERNSYGSSVALTTAGRIVFGGVTRDDREVRSFSLLTGRLSGNGALRWKKTIDSVGGDGIGPIVSDGRDSFYAAGSAMRGGVPCFYTGRFDEFGGGLIWENTEIPTRAIRGSATHLLLDVEGQHAFAAGYTDFGDLDVTTLVKYRTSDGHALWYRRIDPAQIPSSRATALIRDAVGTIVVLSECQVDGRPLLYLAGHNPTSGKIIWTGKVSPDEGIETFRAVALVATPDGGLIVVINFFRPGVGSGIHLIKFTPPIVHG